jgi:GntR family transcriptional regulator, carbon starvation induced regulator
MASQTARRKAIDIGEAGRNLAGSVATRLRDDIVAGGLHPGTKLSIDELRARYGISLSPLREALARLSAEGFVVLEDKKGFRVTPVSRDNCLEVARLQTLMETQALVESIARGGAAWEEQVVAAYHSLSRLERAGRKDGAGVDAWEQQHRRFHAALISACDMPLLLTFCATLHDFSARYRRLFLASHSFDEDVPGEHRAIMKAALDRKPEKASRLLSVHFERTAQNILQAIAQSVSPRKGARAAALR